jgi:hypothetical protein
MRTPAGFECKHFYGNYYRGRHEEECRLLTSQTPPLHWTPDLCKTCPVPAILRANACQHLVLHAEIGHKLLILQKRVKISAYCEKSHTNVAEPEIGCGLCHPEINEYFEKDK